MHIVFLDRETLSPETRLRRPDFDHTWEAHERTSAEQVAERIAQADIVIVNKVKLPAAVLAQAPRLKLIAVAATGTDNIDLAACAAHGIVVSNIRGYATRTVPEHTFALIFALRRSVCAYRDAVRAGRWQAAGQFCFFDHPIRDLAGSTLGIIGDGELGQSVAAIGRALGMRVLFSGHKGRTGQGRLYTPFEQLLGEADVLTLHCPLNDRTRHMISTPEFALMKRRPLRDVPMKDMAPRVNKVAQASTCIQRVSVGQMKSTFVEFVRANPTMKEKSYREALTRAIVSKYCNK